MGDKNVIFVIRKIKMQQLLVVELEQVFFVVNVRI